MHPARLKLIQIGAVAGVAVAAAVAFWLLFTSQHFFDLKIYISAEKWWLDGHELYDFAQPDALQGALYFTYPPFAAMLMLPLGLLPLGVAQTLITVGTVAAVALTTWWLIVPLADRQGWPRWTAVGIAIPLVVLIEPTRATLSFGQINMWLAVLVVADLLVLLPRGSRFAGVGIGIATAIKLTPGLFIVYLLVSRRYRAAAVAAGTTAGVTLLAALISPSSSRDFWFSAILDPSRVGRYDYTANQSLMGLLSRLMLPEQADRRLWLLIAAAVLAFGMWRAAVAGRSGDEVAGLALTGLTAGLISPISWLHHLYWFVPALVAVLGAAVVARGRRRVALFALLIGGYAITVLGVDTLVDWGSELRPTRDAGEFLVRNAFTLLSLLLLVLLPIRRPSNHTEIAPE
ncbi:alpha-1,2-mannosyltransferase [Allocatelliglobosispora scoriae]|uniref:Alpha-1,2-mannosyltransferase n=1 Tax=Allocatelliglobosispora scoriae TaxID=643052 RepID=A0A841BTK8_9ACTN|nr:glycosyltransferase 87 family protein [Allocatelliglobosispora scoriae]MBB5870121.1 alpha-1,2-mannosyltransferase [Allocatelliglobosispora scoriae]